MEQSEYESGSVLERQEKRKSPAIRSYFPGEGFDYLVIAYNAKWKKERAPELETQFILFKDDEEFVRGDINPVGLKETDDFLGIPITRRLFFEETIDPGKYVLQLMVTDKQAKKKDSIATQVVDFEIQKRD